MEGRFRKLFLEMDDLIDYYLLQLPPTYVRNERNIEKLCFFVKNTGISNRLAVEFRDDSWFNDESIDLARKIGFTIVSIDAPIGRWIVSSGNTVYLRLHGRSEWYNHLYSREELIELINIVKNLSPRESMFSLIMIIGCWIMLER